MQGPGLQQQFGVMQWWKALEAHHTQQRQQLGNSSNTQQTTTSGVQPGTWLKGLLGLSTNDAHQQNTVDRLSEVDMGRIQLQVQQLDRTKQEVHLIHSAFEAGPSIWTKS